jgi:hypothetical protein
MHPILGDQLRLRLHLTAWGLAGAIVALLIACSVGVPWTDAFVFGIPMGLGGRADLAVGLVPLQGHAALAHQRVAESGHRVGAGRRHRVSLGRARTPVVAAARPDGFDLPAQTAAEPFALLIGLGALGYLLADHGALRDAGVAGVGRRRTPRAGITGGAARSEIAALARADRSALSCSTA